jgi:hypothetical protein
MRLEPRLLMYSLFFYNRLINARRHLNRQYLYLLVFAHKQMDEYNLFHYELPKGIIITFLYVFIIKCPKALLLHCRITASNVDRLTKI